eukprot:1648474-Lingulodinium_polyedra.AAC.1
MNGGETAWHRAARTVGLLLVKRAKIGGTQRRGRCCYGCNVRARFARGRSGCAAPPATGQR